MAAIVRIGLGIISTQFEFNHIQNWCWTTRNAGDLGLKKLQLQRTLGSSSITDRRLISTHPHKRQSTYTNCTSPKTENSAVQGWVQIKRGSTITEEPWTLLQSYCTAQRIITRQWLQLMSFEVRETYSWCNIVQYNGAHGSTVVEDSPQLCSVSCVGVSHLYVTHLLCMLILSLIMRHVWRACVTGWRSLLRAGRDRLSQHGI